MLNGDLPAPGVVVLRAMLTTASYTPNVDHNVVSDVTNELTTTNYARQTLAGITVTQDDAGDQAIIDCNDIVFASLGNSTQTAAWLIIFERLAAADAVTDPLVCALDIPDTLTDGTTLTIQPAAQGIVAATL